MPVPPSIRVWMVSLVVVVTALVVGARAQTGSRGEATPPLDAAAAAWVDETLASMTLDEKVGQLLVPSFFSTYTSTDSDVFERLATLVRERHVGGILVFGARQPRPDVLLNPTYSRLRLGSPLAAASLLNRLQRVAAVPLLVSADFETGLGFRLEGATTFPRAMAFGAVDDPALAREAGRITGVEARAIGVHVNLAPVADVNNNPRNPVIDTRSFGEDPARVGDFVAAYTAGLRSAGMLATLKHFPGHGDTDVDSHRGLPLIAHDRDRLDRVELTPFRRGLAAGSDAVMTAHIVLPGLDTEEGTPATFSAAVVDDVLRDDLGFDGLVVTDSMQMAAVTRLATAGQAAVRAVVAGHDLVLHSPDDDAAFEALRAAAATGVITETRLDRSVRRVLTAKARLGLHDGATVDLEALPDIVGTRAHAAVAADATRRAITLIKDDGPHVPLDLPADAEILYLSVLDRPTGWGLAAPSRRVIPELEARWPRLTAVELTPRASREELDLVRVAADRYDAVVVGLFMRAATRDGRSSLSEPLLATLRRVGRAAAAADRPFVVVCFGSPYLAPLLEDAPTLLLTYDVGDLAQAAAVQALAGEAAVEGVLPVTLADIFPAGWGLARARVATP